MVLDPGLFRCLVLCFFFCECRRGVDVLVLLLLDTDTGVRTARRHVVYLFSCCAMNIVCYVTFTPLNEAYHFMSFWASIPSVG